MSRWWWQHPRHLPQAPWVFCLLHIPFTPGGDVWGIPGRLWKQHHGHLVFYQRASGIQTPGQDYGARCESAVFTSIKRRMRHWPRELILCPKVLYLLSARGRKVSWPQNSFTWNPGRDSSWSVRPARRCGTRGGFVDMVKHQIASPNLFNQFILSLPIKYFGRMYVCMSVCPATHSKMPGAGRILTKLCMVGDLRFFVHGWNMFHNAVALQ